MVAICAQCLAEIEDMNQVLRKDTYFIESDKGGTYAHPAINIRSMAHKQFKEAAAQLGLSPAARHRLTGALGNGAEAAGGPADFDAEHGGSDSA
jgi:P27 family predicted phage terminase small subunit